SLSHISWNEHMDTTNGMQNHSHRRAAMPYSFKTMAACTYNYRALLPAFRSIMQRCNIIAHWFKSIQKVVEVLNLCNRAETTNGKANSLAHYCRFTNTGI